ncbi:MAG: hypothetical protein WAU20_01310 [Dokdonella sp.]
MGEHRSCGEKAIEIIRHLCGIAIATLRFRGTSLGDDPAQLRRQFRRPSRIILDRCRRWPASNQDTQQHAKRMHVGGQRDRSSARLLGRAIAGSHERPGRLRWRLVFIEQTGDAEVQHLDRSCGGNHDVRGLQVTMDDQGAMSSRHDFAQARNHRDTAALINGPRFAPAIDRHSFDVFHDQERHAVPADAAVDQPRHTGILEPRKDFALAAEAAVLARIMDASTQQLDGGNLGEIALDPLGQEDRALATLTKQTLQAERAKTPADQHTRRKAECCGLIELVDMTGHVLPEETCLVAIRREHQLQFEAQVRIGEVLFHPLLALRLGQIGAFLEQGAQAVIGIFHVYSRRETTVPSDIPHSPWQSKPGGISRRHR